MRARIVTFAGAVSMRINKGNRPSVGSSLACSTTGVPGASASSTVLHKPGAPGPVCMGSKPGSGLD
jgi:hypothetical protein